MRYLALDYLEIAEPGRPHCRYLSWHRQGTRMLRLAFAQLRFRLGRSVALVLVLTATVASLALIGAAARTQQVRVQGTLQADSRAAYDLLVRPGGAQTLAEKRGDLVSSTAMSSLNGGITLKQWHEIE